MTTTDTTSRDSLLAAVLSDEGFFRPSHARSRIPVLPCRWSSRSWPSISP